MPFVPSESDAPAPSGRFVADATGAAPPAKPFVPSGEKPLPSIFEPDVRQLGLTVRAAAQGGAALANTVGDALGMHSSESLSGFLDRLGLPKPSGPTERFSQSVAQSMAGVQPLVEAGNVLKAAEYAPDVARQLGELLSTAPGTQVASSAAGSAAGAAAKAAGLGPTGQFVASLAASAVPGAALPRGPRAIRRAISGVKDEESALRAIATKKRFAEQGVTPSAAQVYKTGPLYAGESYVARSPGGHKTMRDFALAQARQLGDAVERAARVISERSSPMAAGRAIEEGISGEHGFMDRFNETSKALYDALDGMVPKDTLAATDHTAQTLDRLTRPIAGAEKTSQILANARVLEVKRALTSDVAGEPPKEVIDILGPDGKSVVARVPIGGREPRAGLPYFALKELRSRVGELIGDTGLTSDIPRRQLKQLYAAITEDMKTAVEKTGNKAALKLFNRASAYVRAGHQRIDEVLQPVLNRDAPERVYEAAVSGTRKGDTNIHGVMQSLPPKQQRIVASAVLRRLGIAQPSLQDATGESFSVSRFLTNWAAMSPESKRSLFSRFGRCYVENLDKIASIAQDIRDSGQVYANPSGTAPAFTLQTTIGGAVLLTLTGHVGPAAMIGAENSLSYFAARKITDPRFVAWLGKYAYAPVSMLPVALNDLSQSYQERK